LRKPSTDEDISAGCQDLALILCWTKIVSMRLTSRAFENNGMIPGKYTCDYENISPPLSISEVPEGIVSFALIMDDPDVPSNIRKDGLWVHWVVFNIPGELREIDEGVEPDGVGGSGTNGHIGYAGPCPPDREHRYFFKLYALDAMLDFKEGASKEDVESAMSGRVVENAELIGRYNRH